MAAHEHVRQKHAGLKRSCTIQISGLHFPRPCVRNYFEPYNVYLRDGIYLGGKKHILQTKLVYPHQHHS